MAWYFWVDRGGTFTDVMGQSPEGHVHVKKLLSENPECYEDAAIEGIRQLMGSQQDDCVSIDEIAQIRMGTTIATNALLERKGDRVGLLISQGCRDLLRIGYQNRPDLFALDIILPVMLYECVEEVIERMSVNGDVLQSLDTVKATEALTSIYDQGIRSVAIVLLHSYRYPEHEQQVKRLAELVGFQDISISSEVSPLMKAVSRGDTTVLDSYLSPLLNRYVHYLQKNFQHTPLYFMKSSGGLVDARYFRAKDSILSGPAGGVVGAVQTTLAAGYHGVIGFDMGGTSTDVSHYYDHYEKDYETVVSGVRLRLPMLAIHTIAAGGGSVVSYKQGRFQAGPTSAGAVPGPCCYRRGGPLTITDCNVMMGKIQTAYFPSIFGKKGDQPLDSEAVQQAFSDLQCRLELERGSSMSCAAIAEGFINVAVNNMANAIKKISIQKGHDIANYVLNCFGGAGGQHACLVADELGLTTVLVHQYASVLSAYGMGLADVVVHEERVIESILSQASLDLLDTPYHELEGKAKEGLLAQQIELDQMQCQRILYLKYQGTNTTLPIYYDKDLSVVMDQFHAHYLKSFGFTMDDTAVVVEMVAVEANGHVEVQEMEATLIDTHSKNRASFSVEKIEPKETVRVFSHGEWLTAGIFLRDILPVGGVISGPAIIIDDITTVMVEPLWQAELNTQADLVLHKVGVDNKKTYSTTKEDPILLEVFNNLTMSIAEQMGEALVNTAYSVNIKERRDFSCAIFDKQGSLIANAPHIPIHLGSMGASVKAVMQHFCNEMKPEDVYMLNDPYHGGTHLPDITTVTPVFLNQKDTPIFYVASRGHHADIGGITPGSMPAFSRTLEEEGVVIQCVKLVDQGVFLQEQVRDILLSAAYPARCPDRNIADLKAQVAANAKGVESLLIMCDQFGYDVVSAYMGFIKKNAAQVVKALLPRLQSGRARIEMDNGGVCQVEVRVDALNEQAVIDFSGTSAQLPNNYNAPLAVTRAAVLYVFRILVQENIPLNDGCLEPIDIVIPSGSFLDPQSPAAVVAGNVETSQVIVDALLSAVGVLANSQGTTNNLTFGNDHYQYYETIGGGAGAGNGFDGASAVQTHITNSLLTDPEVFEYRFPVVVRDFSIRHHSGGDGKYRGGDGIVRELEFLEDFTVNILSERRTKAPLGIAGGGPALCGINEVFRKDGTVEVLKGQDQVFVKAGDRIRIKTPGGGGYGSCE